MQQLAVTNPKLSFNINTDDFVKFFGFDSNPLSHSQDESYYDNIPGDKNVSYQDFNYICLYEYEQIVQKIKLMTIILPEEYSLIKPKLLILTEDNLLIETTPKNLRPHKLYGNYTYLMYLGNNITF